MTLPAGPQLDEIRCACLIVLDGWGMAPAGPGNAIALADTPVVDELWAQYPHAELSASGPSVGLPEGQMGNSEVGHLTLGAGAAVPQTLTLIDRAVRGGELAANSVVCDAVTAGERVHLVGLVSDGGVHSSFEHLQALIDLAGQLGVVDHPDDQLDAAASHGLHEQTVKLHARARDGRCDLQRPAAHGVGPVRL